jgi:hypothetical protein
LSSSFEEAVRSHQDMEACKDQEKAQSFIPDNNDYHVRPNSNDNTALNNPPALVQSESKWYEFPHHSQMSPYQWTSVSVGVLFVTFLCPAMSNYALFELPISLCLTLTSLGPVYSLPLVFILLGEKSGPQGIIGSILAVAGIAIMCV